MALRLELIISRQSAFIWDSIGGAMTGLEVYVGQVLDDKYHLEKLLGQGGMGAVFLATHLGTERYVALKLIAPQFMRNEEFVERFKREARAAGRLRHPNVVDVTDFGFASVRNGQVAYLVMEYLDGCTLGDVLSEEKRLPLEWVVDILEQVCSAVHEAHQQGIVHRDLKPDNIWLEPNRLGGYRVKVLDFGIAKLAEVNAPDACDDDSHEPVPAETLNAHVAVANAAALETATLLLKHILIVAPYNAQVSALARSLPAGARVGTVDKFQGQEAPVVIYSMTTSTPEDAPRGTEFLYSSNRLNVATSRAQCVTVLVASPALFDVECKTPRQMELANAFCRYLEMAQVV